jgi:hypothetical protein
MRVRPATTDGEKPGNDREQEGSGPGRTVLGPVPVRGRPIEGADTLYLHARRGALRHAGCDLTTTIETDSAAGCRGWRLDGEELPASVEKPSISLRLLAVPF